MEQQKDIKSLEDGKSATISDYNKEIRKSEAQCRKCFAEIMGISSEMKKLKYIPEEEKKLYMTTLEEELVDQRELLDLYLGKIHLLKSKKIKDEMIKCIDDIIEMLKISRAAMEPYILEWETELNNHKKFKIISKIIVDGQVFIRDDDPILFDFINCGLGIVLSENPKNIGYYYDEPVLAKIPTSVDDKSLEDLRIVAIKSYVYYLYLLKLTKQLCVKYGHEWELKNSSFNHITNKFEAECVCSCCKEALKEEFTSEAAMEASFGIKRRIHEMNPDLRLPKFKLEDYFVKVDSQNRRLKSKDEVGRLLVPYDWITKSKK